LDAVVTLRRAVYHNIRLIAKRGASRVAAYANWMSAPNSPFFEIARLPHNLTAPSFATNPVNDRLFEALRAYG